MESGPAREQWQRCNDDATLFLRFRRERASRPPNGVQGLMTYFLRRCFTPAREISRSDVAILKNKNRIK